MSTTLQTYGRFASLIDEELVAAGSVETPVSYGITGTAHRRTDSIANAANTTVYNDELGTFNFLYLVSDMNTRVVLTDTNSNSFSLQLRGTGETGKYGVPLMIGLDETADANTTLNSLVVHNDSGSTAKVLCIVVK